MHSLNANVVFDLDGTLIDSAPDIHAIANDLLLARGRDPIDLATARGFIGRGAPAFIAQLAQACDLPESEQSQMLKDFLTLYEDAVTLTHPYPGVEEALTRLAASHRLGICTNKPHRPCLAVLRHLGLDRFFAAVLGGDSLPVRKPDPRPLLETFAQLGDGPDIYVGDSETDAETAQRAGVPLILFTRGYRKAPVADIPHAAAFDDFADLREIVTNVLSRRAR
jgi:phosphoglycolate phosphatase